MLQSRILQTRRFEMYNFSSIPSSTFRYLQRVFFAPYTDAHKVHVVSEESKTARLNASCCPGFASSVATQSHWVYSGDATTSKVRRRTDVGRETTGTTTALTINSYFHYPASPCTKPPTTTNIPHNRSLRCPTIMTS